MQERDGAKTAALVIGLAVMGMAVVRAALPEEWISPTLLAGISADATWLGRLAHPFVHGGLLHAALNVYVLWQLVFFWPVRLRHLVLAYALACSCPVAVTAWGGAADARVVGLSGVLYALTGWLLPGVGNPLRCCVAVVLWSVAGWWSGHVAVGLHLYCFGGGMAAALFVRLLSVGAVLRRSLARWWRGLL